MIFWDIDIQSWITFDKSVRNLFKADSPPFVHWGPAESKIKMAVVLRAPWGMSLKLEFDPLFMVAWDNQVQETWKLISFPKYDMPLTLSVWLPSSSPGYFKIPLDVTLSSKMHAAGPVWELRDSGLPLGAGAQLKHLLLCFPSKRNSITVFQEKASKRLVF